MDNILTNEIETGSIPHRVTSYVNDTQDTENKGLSQYLGAVTMVGLLMWVVFAYILISIF